MFSKLKKMIWEVIHRMIPYKDIAQVERIESPLSPEMITALDEWYLLYLNKADWLRSGSVKSLNLPAFICSEIARQVVLELDWNITGAGSTPDEPVVNPRAEYLKKEFDKLMSQLRKKLEQGLAAGGMAIRPYPNTEDGHIYFTFTMDWGLYPVAFGDNGALSDVIFRDTYTEGNTTYTRLERHRAEGANVRITQRAFKSTMRDAIGVEVPLTDVAQWASLEPEAVVLNTDGQMFGWFSAAAANNVDVDSPMGASVYAKAIQAIKEADLQYSRLLWEFEGSELAVDVDPQVLRPRADGRGGMETPKLNERLFRGVDLGTDETYKVFSPAIRDASIINGLNEILMRVEDLSGLSRGTVSNVNMDARTATELKINKQRSYDTISDNQKALETCLRDVIRVMDKFATLYQLAPEGEYDVSFDWGDAVITDRDSQTQERLLLLNSGVIGKEEFREWYFGETKAQAKAAIESIQQEELSNLALQMPQILEE